MVKTENFDISSIISGSSNNFNSWNKYSFTFDRSGEVLVEGDDEGIIRMWILESK